MSSPIASPDISPSPSPAANLYTSPVSSPVSDSGTSNPSPSPPVTSPGPSPVTSFAPVPSNKTGINAAKNLLDYEKDKLLSVTSNTFWGNNPNVLFIRLDLFPNSAMTFNQNLNAITRFIILLTIFMAIITGRVSVFFIGVITIFFIYLYQYIFHKKTGESFENANTEYSKLERLQAVQKLLFDESTAVNPFGNVLNSDIEGNPKKRPAPPIDDPEVKDAIFESARQAMILNNPSFPDIDKKLLQNLGDVYEFEQSLQPFYTNPATTIPNDQNSFADFCYGSMISCKEGNLFACARNNTETSHYNKY
jgi:hypothetical protein